MAINDRQENVPGTAVIQVVAGATNLVIGNGASYFTVPPSLSGFDLTDVHARVVTAGTGSAVSIQIHNVTDAVDMLSTPITIDATETGSDTAATPPGISAGAAGVATNDLIRIDIDAVGSGTPAQGLVVRMGFETP